MKEMSSGAYSDIAYALQLVNNQKLDFVIISIGDYYVQFCFTQDKRFLTFEAVSSEYLPKVGDRDTEFKQLGFRLAESGNYQKFISVADVFIDSIVSEIKAIFETIYHVDFNSYKIDEG